MSIETSSHTESAAGARNWSQHYKRHLLEQNRRYRTALNNIASSAACLPGYSIAEAAQEARDALSDETRD